MSAGIGGTPPRASPLATMTNDASPAGGRSVSSLASILARRGIASSSPSAKRATPSGAPSTSTVTPSESLRTNPTSPSPRAYLKIVGLNPTPCVTPRSTNLRLCFPAAMTRYDSSHQ